jgi:ProP effector
MPSRASIKQSDARAAFALLGELFPKTFAVHEAKRRPLKINIHVDIIAKVNGAIEPHELVAALRAYCGNAVYLSRLRPGAVRIDLDGNAAGTVTAAEAARAAEQLATRVLKMAARKKPAPPAQASVPTGPKRLTLPDLKELAVMRRQGGQHG